MNPVDLARVAVAVEDNAHRYYGGPLHLGRTDAARYIAEGHLPRYPLEAAWNAAADYIDAHPQVLTYTPAQVEQAQAARAARCAALDVAAGQAYADGRYGDAIRLVDEAELVDPDHLIQHQSWTDLRDFITAEARQHQP